MTDVYVRADDLRKAAQRYETAREDLGTLALTVGGPVPSMPADLRQAAIAAGVRTRADLKQQAQYLGEEARDLRRRAGLADLVDAGLPPGVAPAALGLTLFSGTVRRLSFVFHMPKAPTRAPKYNWMQKAGRFSFSLGAGALDAVSFGAFGKVVDKVGLSEVYDRDGLASKLGEYGSYALGVSAVAKHGVERFAVRRLEKRTAQVAAGGAEMRTSRELAARSRQLLGKDGDVVVLGRQPDTEVAEHWPGHVILKTKDWSDKLNPAFIKEAVRQRRSFYLGSPVRGNVIQTTGRYAGQPTIYAQELRQLRAAGYVRRGDMMVPP